MGQGRYYRRSKPPRKWRRLVFLLGCLLLILAVAYTARIAFSLQSFHNQEDWAQQLRQQEPDDQKIYLIYGVDYWGASPYVERLVLLCQDSDDDSLKVVYVPGNTLAHSGEEALGQVYQRGGSSEFIKYLQDFLGLSVHHYLQVYYQGLVELEDLWGEVAVGDLPGKLPELIPEGKQSLGGFELYRYFLTSGYQETALEQLERQRQTLLAIWKKLGNQHAWRRPGLFRALSPYLETDLSWRELQALQERFKDYSFSDVQVIHLPGGEEVIHNRLYWVVGPQDIKQLASLLRGEGPAVAEVRVEILNGSGVPGQAGSLAEILTREGLQVVRTGNADHFFYQTTEVIALGEAIEPARTVAAYIPGSVIMHQFDPQAEADVRVVIGQDYLQAGDDN